jgi:hypothetical protein
LAAALAGLLMAPRAQGQEPEGQPPREVSLLSGGSAAGVVAVANAPGAAGLLINARSMALWGDWPSNREFLELCAYIKAAARATRRQFDAKAREDQVTLADLLRAPADADQYREKALHLEGTLNRLRRWEPAERLKLAGVRNLYEAFVKAGPLDSVPVTVLITELPAGLRVGDKLNEPVHFEALFFKLEPGPGKDVPRAPLLIGRTLRVRGKPAPTERPGKKAELATPPPVGPLVAVARDRTRIPTPDTDAMEFWGYCETVLVASRVTPEGFAERARENKDATFAKVFDDPDKYRGRVLRVKGTLARLRRVDSPEYLKVRGIPYLYEGWVFVAQGTPWCVIFPDLPRGVKVAEKLSQPVTLDGYFFKKLRYTAVKEDRYTLLVIGRTLQVPSTPGGDRSGTILPLLALLGGLILGAVVLIGALVFGLNWWFRRADQVHRARMEAARAAAFGEPRAADQAAVNPFADFPEPAPEGQAGTVPADGQGAEPAPPTGDQGFRANGD